MNRRLKKRMRKLMPYVLVTVLAILTIIGVLIFTKESGEPDPTSSETTSTEPETSRETEESTSESVEETEFPTASAVDILNVNDLIDRYYDAKINDDADTLNAIVECEKPYTVAELADESQYISKYDNFTTYVIPGITDEYFLVYVKYDIFFNGINRGAAALNHFIVVKDSDGFYHIYDKEITGEFSSYIQKTEESDTVKALKNQVEEELAQACKDNEDLDYLIKVLTGAEVLSTDSASADEKATAPETEPAEETTEENQN